jgi:hypothetical protein
LAYKDRGDWLLDQDRKILTPSSINRNLSIGAGAASFGAALAVSGAAFSFVGGEE